MAPSAPLYRTVAQQIKGFSMWYVVSNSCVCEQFAWSVGFHTTGVLDMAATTAAGLAASCRHQWVAAGAHWRFQSPNNASVTIRDATSVLFRVFINMLL